MPDLLDLIEAALEEDVQNIDLYGVLWHEYLIARTALIDALRRPASQYIILCVYLPVLRRKFDAIHDSHLLNSAGQAKLLAEVTRLERVAYAA